MIPLSLAEVAVLTGGRLEDGADPHTRVDGPVVADSRQVGPGALARRLGLAAQLLRDAPGPASPVAPAHPQEVAP